MKILIKLGFKSEMVCGFVTFTSGLETETDTEEAVRTNFLLKWYFFKSWQGVLSLSVEFEMNRNIFHSKKASENV